MKDDSMVWTLGIAQLTAYCTMMRDQRVSIHFSQDVYQKPTLIKKNCDNQNPCMRGISSSNL
jgi:hypothetical protein